jgi:glycosyltransferase involved in cell wall biosynthesis
MTKYKILIYSPTFLPDPNPEAFVNANLAQAFISQGHHVDIITRKTGKEGHFSFNTKNNQRWNILKNHIHFVTYKDNKSTFDYVKNIWACFSSLTILKGNKVWKREYALGKKMHIENNYDFILARAMPVVGLLAGFMLSKKFKIPLLVNINDPTITSPPPYPNYRSWTFPFISHFLKRVVKQASAVSYPSKWLMEYENSFHNIPLNEKMCVIPHIANISFEKKETETNLKSVFKIVHAGTLGKIRNPLNFVTALNNLLKKYPDEDIKLILLGVIADKWKTKINILNNKNVEFIGKVSQEEAFQILSDSSVQLIIEACCDKGIFLPSKFIDYIQNQQPILAVSPKTGTLNDFISKYNVGRAVNCNDVNEIFIGLEELLLSWKGVKKSNHFYFDEAIDAFSDKILIKYHKIFDDIKKCKK